MQYIGFRKIISGYYSKQLGTKQAPNNNLQITNKHPASPAGRQYSIFNDTNILKKTEKLLVWNVLNFYNWNLSII